MTPSFIRTCEDGVDLFIRVKPRASRTRVVGEREGWLEIQISAPPVEGAANDALIAFLSDVLGVPRRHLSLAAGQSARQKRVRVSGLTPERARDALLVPA